MRRFSSRQYQLTFAIVPYDESTHCQPLLAEQPGQLDVAYCDHPNFDGPPESLRLADTVGIGADWKAFYSNTLYFTAQHPKQRCDTYGA